MNVKLLTLSILIKLATINLTAMAQDVHKTKLKEKFLSDIQKLTTENQSIPGWYIIDADGNEIYTHNEDLIFPQASAIKIPILAEVVQQSTKGKFKLSDEVKLDKDKYVGGSGVLNNFQGSVTLTIHDICMLMLKYSDNSATNFLINLVGMDNINNTLKNHGLADIKLQRVMMDVNASQAGRENIASPKAAALLMHKLIQGKLVNKEVSERTIDLLEYTSDINGRLKAHLPKNCKVLFKPGQIPGVSTEWAIFYIHEKPVVVVAMESMIDENENAETMEKAGLLIYKYFDKLYSASPYGAFFK